MSFTFQPIGSGLNGWILAQQMVPSLVYLVPMEIPIQVQPESEEKPELLNGSRRAWSRQEDNRVLQLIDLLSLKSFDRIPYSVLARYFPQRTSKQIRERYLNNLDPNILKTPFEPEEDEVIIRFYQANGPCWKRLSKLMPGRTSTSIKNRFNAKLKKQMVSSQNDGVLKAGQAQFGTNRRKSQIRLE